MKLTTFRSQILNVPEDEPLAGALEKEGSTRPIVILTLGTDSGVEGIGVSFYGGALTKTLKSAIDQLCELCVGEDVRHVIPEFHAHLIAGVPNGLTVEYMPWMLKLFAETPALEKGELVLGDKPGFDLAFDQDAVRRFAA